MEKHSLTSPAYINTVDDCMTYGRSLIIKPKSKGPSWLPCGTPEVTLITLEIVLLKQTIGVSIRKVGKHPLK